MKTTIETPSGKFVSITTRRGNYTNIVFGKFTFWPSRKHYETGNCEGSETITGIHLGYAGEDLTPGIQRVIAAETK